MLAPFPKQNSSHLGIQQIQSHPLFHDILIIGRVPVAVGEAEAGCWEEN